MRFLSEMTRLGWGSGAWGLSIDCGMEVFSSSGAALFLEAEFPNTFES